MEVKGGIENSKSVLVYEAMGTCWLLMSINIGVNQTSSEIVAVAIFCAIISFDRVSGAHFNPAVTLAVLIKTGFKHIGFAVAIILS